MLYIVVSFALSFLNPQESLKIFGALAGLLLGFHLARKLKLPSKLYGTERTLSLLASLVGVISFWWALKLIFAALSLESPFLTMDRYFILCFWLTFISPYFATQMYTFKKQKRSS
jgi:hypothetical protein